MFLSSERCVGPNGCEAADANSDMAAGASFESTIARPAALSQRTEVGRFFALSTRSVLRARCHAPARSCSSADSRQEGERAHFVAVAIASAASHVGSRASETKFLI